MQVTIRKYTDSDAAGVAEMWNESNEGWPGGFLPFIEFTSERVREIMRKSDYLAVYLALLDEKVVGYCTLAERSQDKNVSYIPLLNAHPSYHGKKIGKQVLMAAVNESIRRGYDRLDLHTWAGNVKAVPLYKKTGFFWVPGTQVYMQNFMPLVFQNPIARRFFDKHDWYATQVRDLSTAVDKMSWEEREAYLYEWREGDDYLKIAIDRHCGGITSIETPSILVSSRLDTDRPSIGQTHSIAWRLENRSSNPMRLSLRARGDEGLDVNRQTGLDLKGQETLEADVTACTDFVERESFEQAPAVQTDVTADGESFVLKTGVRAKYALELGAMPDFVSLLPGSTKTVAFTLKNRSAKPLKGRLVFLLPSGLSFQPEELPISLQPDAVAGFDVAVHAAASSGFVVKPMFEAASGGEKMLLPVKELAVASVGFDDVVSASYGNCALLQNEHVRLFARRSFGWVALFDLRERNHIVQHWVDRLGVPFTDEFRKIPYAMHLEECPQGKVLVMKNKSQAFPGVELEKRITLGRGPIIRFDYVVKNFGQEKRALKLSLGHYKSPWACNLAIPLKEGILTTHATDFPAWEMDLPDKPEDFAESWSAFADKKGVVAGLIWQDASSIEFGGEKLPVLTFDLGEIPPLGQAQIPSQYLYLGAGDYRIIRHHWQRLTGKSIKSDLPVLDSVTRIEASEEPLFVSSGHKKVLLRVSHHRNAQVNGTASLYCSDLEVSPERFDIEGVCLSTPAELDLTINASGPTRILPLQTMVETQTSSYVRTLAVFVSNDRPPRLEVKQAPKVSGNRVVKVDNGEMAMLVSPEFAGSLFSIQRAGKEYLHSSFPEARALSWFNPWFGGFRVSVKKHSERLWEEPDEMHKVGFKYSKCSRRDATGNLWEGVRLSGPMVKDELKGIELRVEYLTLANSNVALVCPQVLNTTDAPFRVWLLAECFLTRRDKDSLTSYYKTGGQFFSRKSTDSAAEIYSDGWLCAEDSKLSTCLAMVTDASDCDLVCEDLGADGHSFFSCKDLWIPPHGSSGHVFALALVDSLEEAKLCEVLRAVRFPGLSVLEQ